jgi:hypothetical protein
VENGINERKDILMKEINASIKIDGKTHIVTADWTIFKKLVLQAITEARAAEIEQKIISSILEDDTSPGGTD